ncbi:Phosphopentomutase [Metamycoplasma cloacale]|uniref:Phosphopentomutase n=1 Tax=Metamycoplasma cloacale TaxID=92401 RepID=A0A2Z4LM72_9BACT|nr:phosphopentomutase [Metamycoplasma cloacale]AWX42568.1 phosphopentomutase [Metamycoplasma cloacale]VEU79730.1 Phosphopentomutase [Metamycoplasma cloacale]
MPKFNRIFFIVTDGLGIGEEPRQKEFGDKGANSFLHASEVLPFKIPTWTKLGITEVAKMSGHVARNKHPLGYVGRIHEMSNGKDTLTGHWEMMGIYTKVPNPQFVENGFPQELVDELSKAWDNRKIIGNRAASGTVILQELGDQHIETGDMIIYTSPDSTLQICGDENTLGLDKLNEYAKKARQICSSRPEWNVARIISRPFIKQEDGKFVRTFNRHDHANKPTGHIILEDLQQKGVEVVAVGKINDIFTGVGIDKVYGPASDDENMDVAIDIASSNSKNQFVFVNLVQFDSHYGHRRDPIGYSENISRLDVKLTKLINAMKDDDLLIMTSDHGNDPTMPGSDHTREALPLTVFSKSFKQGKVLGELKGLGTAGNIVARNFEVPLVETGEDIFEQLI